MPPQIDLMTYESNKTLTLQASGLTNPQDESKIVCTFHVQEPPSFNYPNGREVLTIPVTAMNGNIIGTRLDISPIGNQTGYYVTWLTDPTLGDSNHVVIVVPALNTQLLNWPTPFVAAEK